MSEAEVLELIAMHGGTAVNSFAVFLTLLFSYMTVAYFAGGKLSGVQAAIISLIYVMAMAGWILTVLTYIQSYEILVADYPGFVTSPLWALPWSLMVGVVNCSATIASLYFMYDIRRQNKP